MEIGNVKFKDKCCSQHLLMGSARMNEHKDTEQEHVYEEVGTK